MSVEKYIKDGKVAVIISPCFGAGWSTWSSEFSEFLLFDKGLVELFLAKAPTYQVEKYLKEKLGENVYVYTGGWSDAEIEWLDEGTAFYVNEYDGAESIHTAADFEFVA